MTRVLDFAIFYTPGDKALATSLKTALNKLGADEDKWKGKVVETLSVM